VEDWFYEGLEFAFDKLLMERRLAVPSVKLETTFLTPTRMGETVDFWLTVSHLGRSSIRFTMGVDKDGEHRVRMNRVIVCVDQRSGKAVPIPEDMREKVQAFMVG
jgi:4-hydroxybenzoyl-CoA thioesterase